MAFSYIEYTADGATTTFAVPFEYIAQEDVKVFVDGVEDSGASFTSPSTVQTSTTPSNGALVRVERTTDLDARAVDFASGSVLTEEDLDNSNIQVFFAAQEAIDTAESALIQTPDGKWDGQSRVIKNVTDPTNAQDAVTKNYLENTWLTLSDKAQLNALDTDNLDRVFQSVDNLDRVHTSIDELDRVHTSIAKVDRVHTSIANVDRVHTSIDNIDRVEDSITNVDRVATSADNLDRVHTSIGNVDRVDQSIDNVDRVATSADNLDRVHTSISNLDRVHTSISAVDTVAADLNEPTSEIETVAGSITNVNNVGNNIQNVLDVDANESNINAAVANENNINAAVANESNINAAVSNESNITAVADNETNINQVATDTVAVTTVSTNIGDVTTVSSNIADVTNVSDNMTAVTNVSNNMPDISAVEAEVTKVVEVANDLQETVSEIETVANSIANVDAVGQSIDNVNTVATNIADVNNFADTYSIGATAPVAPTTGDLWFDTASSTMKVYDGSGFVNAGSSVNGVANSVEYTATAGQTSFAATYDAGYVDVYLNGVKLSDGDYTATDGSNVVLNTGASAGDIVFIQSFGTFTLADVYNKGEVDAFIAPLATTTYVDTAEADAVSTANAYTDSALAGISSDALIDSNSVTRVQATTGGATVVGNTAATALSISNELGGTPAVLGVTTGSDLLTYVNGTERMRIDSAGRVTMPYQPSFRTGRDSGNVSSGNVILFNSIFHNTGSHYNAATGRFTAPIAGRYLLGFTGFNAQDTDTQFYFRKNGNNIGYSLAYGTMYSMLTQVLVVDLAVNDYVEAYIAVGIVYAAGSPQDCTFTGHLIG